jgi:hypothetical protein
MQHKCHIVGTCKFMIHILQGTLSREREEACFGFVYARQFNDPDVTGLGHSAYWGIYPFLYNQCLRTQSGQVEIEFTGAIGGIKRRTRDTGSHSETSYRHLGTMWQYQSDPILAT